MKVQSEIKNLQDFKKFTGIDKLEKRFEQKINDFIMGDDKKVKK